jgi:long-chain acyl-CoA synthetase
MSRLADTGVYQPTDREQVSLRQVIRYETACTLMDIWPEVAQRFGEITALIDPHHPTQARLTYKDLLAGILAFASGLQQLGIQPAPAGELPPRIALFADNSHRWFIADQGILRAGAANAVRSATADPEELRYILEDSGAIALVVENLDLYQQLADFLSDLPVQFVVLLSDEIPPQEAALPVYGYQEVLEKGKGHPPRPLAYDRETLATLIYTSGTTGRPKGVMLCHRNLLHQVNSAGMVVQPQPGNVALSILPTWHSYERAVEYYLLSQGCTQIYTNLRSFKKDLCEYKPQYMVSVPRLWEAIYEAIQKQLEALPASRQRLVRWFLNLSRQYIQAKRVAQGLNLQALSPSTSAKLQAQIQARMLAPLHRLGDQLVYRKVREAATGGKLKAVISGGGSLAEFIDTFFEIIGIELLVGYGLTETSPILTVRRLHENLRGSAGQPLLATEIRIVDPETRRTLHDGERGLVLARGPQVMQGYFNQPQATAKAINGEGWFDTGDLGMLVRDSNLVLTGRAKDTIVLTNGENIEPQPIEDACLRSPYLDQIMLVGQDQRSLGALIVPNLDFLQRWAATQVPEALTSDGQLDLSHPVIQALYRQELNREVRDRPGYRVDDRIGPFELLDKPFTIDNGLLTQTLKLKRPVVAERYRDIIDQMFQ